MTIYECTSSACKWKGTGTRTGKVGPACPRCNSNVRRWNAGSVPPPELVRKPKEKELSR